MNFYVLGDREAESPAVAEPDVAAERECGGRFAEVDEIRVVDRAAQAQLGAQLDPLADRVARAERELGNELPVAVREQVGLSEADDAGVKKGAETAQAEPVVVLAGNAETQVRAAAPEQRVAVAGRQLDADPECVALFAAAEPYTADEPDVARPVDVAHQVDPVDAVVAIAQLEIVAGLLAARAVRQAESVMPALDQGVEAAGFVPDVGHLDADFDAVGHAEAQVARHAARFAIEGDTFAAAGLDDRMAGRAGHGRPAEAAPRQEPRSSTGRNLRDFSARYSRIAPDSNTDNGPLSWSLSISACAAGIGRASRRASAPDRS